MERFNKQSAAFLSARAEGYTPVQAAALAGVTLWTLQRWKALGHPATARPGIDDHFIAFRKAWLARDQ